MSTVLPELTDHKGYKEALKQQKKAAGELEKTKAAVLRLARELEEADAAGADHKTLKVIEDTIAAGERTQELADRCLREADHAVQEQRTLAEADIKAQAREAGGRIANKILRALTQVEKAQVEYRQLQGELRQKVRFEKPLSGENAERYAGPDPSSVLKPLSYSVEGYRGSAKQYLQGWPEPEKPQKQEAAAPEAPDIFILS